MKQLKLHVSNSDIKNGEQANPQDCAIARTLKRNKQLNLKDVSVLHNVCTIKTINKRGKINTYRASLPEEAQNFIKKFDHGKAVAPLAFVLNFVKSKQAELVHTTSW